MQEKKQPIKRTLDQIEEGTLKAINRKPKTFAQHSERNRKIKSDINKFFAHIKTAIENSNEHIRERIKAGKEKRQQKKLERMSKADSHLNKSQSHVSEAGKLYKTLEVEPEASYLIDAHNAVTKFNETKSPDALRKAEDALATHIEKFPELAGAIGFGKGEKIIDSKLVYIILAVLLGFVILK